jgi:hypothetical protein
MIQFAWIMIHPLDAVGKMDWSKPGRETTQEVPTI